MKITRTKPYRRVVAARLRREAAGGVVLEVEGEPVPPERAREMEVFEASTHEVASLRRAGYRLTKTPRKENRLQHIQIDFLSECYEDERIVSRCAAGDEPGSFVHGICRPDGSLAAAAKSRWVA